MKDEGKDGDRDFLQWDTVSLMSLLNVHVIIAYYSSAQKSPRYANKITQQKFDIRHIENQLAELLHFKSDALHWNLKQLEQAEAIGTTALEYYRRIGQTLNVELKSPDSAKRKIDMLKDMNTFRRQSRKLAQEAQRRESKTDHPFELVQGVKGNIDIQNSVGGIYHLTADELEIREEQIRLIEAKNTTREVITAVSDIKDGLLKMVLFSNLEPIKFGETELPVVPVLKLTSTSGRPVENLGSAKRKFLKTVLDESRDNGFLVELPFDRAELL